MSRVSLTGSVSSLAVHSGRLSRSGAMSTLCVWYCSAVYFKVASGGERESSRQGAVQQFSFKA